MPTISKTSGTAIINTGFITLLFQALTSLWLLEEEGSEPGDAFRCRTGTEVDATPKICGPACYLLRAITAFTCELNHPGRELLSNSEQCRKNYRRRFRLNIREFPNLGISLWFMFI